MSRMSRAGGWYLAFCLATCGYFSMAAVNGWPGPNFAAGPSGSGHSSGHVYSSGWSGGRSSGGFGGGGK